jgi:hypothetical protein
MNRTTISVRKAAVLAAVIPVGIVLIIAMVFLVAPAAQAAPPSDPGRPVQFSDDGVQWSNNYTRALFGDVLLVPGGSADRPFYVRNGAADPAILRVTLYGVAATDIDLAAAMTVSTSVPGRPGASVPITDARPCAILSQGQVVPAGDSVRLDNVAALADLSGTSGQARHVSFKLAITLSSIDSAAPQPNSCPTDFDATVIGSPGPGSGTSSQPVYHLGAGGWTPVPATVTTPAPTPSATPTAPADPSGPPSLGTLVGNTERFYQENTVALWLAMAALGAIILLVVRRRRPDDGVFIQQYPYSRQPTSQIGTGR